MPWTASDADKHIKGLSDSQKSGWAKIANNALSECQKKGGSDCEGYAIRVANSKSKNVGKFEMVKYDDDRRLVFGWASVAVQKNGATIVDSQGDMIAPEDLEAAAYRFVLEDGDTNVMHGYERVGRPVESFVVTPEKLEKMGLPPDALPQGWWLGVYVEDDRAWDAVKRGEFRAFSIEGRAEREAA